MTITESVSDEPQTCWRCTTLGLLAGGIAPGELYLTIRAGIVRISCMDCFRRLQDDLSEASTTEGEG